MRMTIKGLTLLITAVCVVSADSAQAGFQVTLSVDADAVTIVDGGAGDLDATVGVIQLEDTTVGGYTFSATLANTNAGTGDSTISFVNGADSMISGSGAGNISIYASANGFMTPSSPPDLLVLSDGTFRFLSETPLGQTARVSLASFYDPTNSLSASATGTVIGQDADNLETASPTLLTDVSTEEFLTTPYALNLQLSALVGDGQNILDLDGGVRVFATPEPTSMALMGLGGLLAGFGVIRRKRRNADDDLTA